MSVTSRSNSRARWLKAAEDFQRAMLRHAEALKYDPNQPRVPAGHSDGGQWTGKDGETENAGSDDAFAAILSESILAAGRLSINKCIDLCSPLLERFQRPGSDRNYFDFQKCLNICLQR